MDQMDRLGSGTRKSTPHILVEFRDRIDRILAEDAALKVTDLNINGNDLIREFSLKPSPIIGQTLNYLLELVLDEPNLNNYDSLKNHAAEFLKNHH